MPPKLTQAHPVRTLVLLCCACMAGLVAPLVFDDLWRPAFLLLVLLSIGVACRPWIAGVLRRH